MKTLGTSRGVAAVLAAALGLSLAIPASAQQPKPADKPAQPAQPAQPAKPAAPAAKPAGQPAKPAAPAAKKPDARALFASGEKKFKAGEYAEALTDFEAALEAKSTPETQRYVALAHDNLGHYEQAVAAYEKFIADAPAKMKDQVEEAQKRVEAIKAMPAKVRVETTPAGATVVIDQPPAQPGQEAPQGGTPAPGPTPTDVELAPGKHTLTITAEGYEPMTKELEVTYASKQDLAVELVKKPEPPPPPPPPPVVAEQPAPPPPPPPPPPPEPRSKVPAYVTGAVAIVAAGVGTGFGIKALQQESDFEKNPTTKKADDGENNALVADMMFGIAITFGVTSAVLFLSSDAPATAKAAPTKAVAAPKKKMTIIPAPYVSPTGGGAGAVVRF